eukprot:257866-Chlamydomonas_euryale.AAC.1
MECPSYSECFKDPKAQIHTYLTPPHMFVCPDGAPHIRRVDEEEKGGGGQARSGRGAGGAQRARVPGAARQGARH